MKINFAHVTLLLAAGGLALVSGCVVEPNGAVAFQPFVVAAPAPVVVAPEPVGVPDDYVWDGYEYVGIVGGQYYYLGPGNVWVVCEPFRLERFHGWEGYHRDWHSHAIHNDHFRGARNAPRRGGGHDDHGHH